MADFDTLKKVLGSALQQAGSEASMLLGQSLSVGESDALLTNRMTYFADMENALLVVGVESREDYPGQFQLIFTLRDAILLSGLLLGIPPARINEKRRLAIMEADDTDAFGEIMNQFIGSFNSVFQPGFSRKTHLKLLTSRKFVPGIDQLTDREPLADGEYLLYRVQLNMQGQEMDKLDLLVPQALACLFDPPQPKPVAAVAEEEAGEEFETAAEGPPAAAAPAFSPDAAIIILDDDELERGNLRASLAGIGLKLLDAELHADIRELIAQGAAKLAVVGVKDTDDRELALCIKLKSLLQDTPLPIIMCAPSWTRSGVLRALKYGASDIVLKPYVADEMVAKVRKFLQAA
jgi:CheY-like chemotaxis protein